MKRIVTHMLVAAGLAICAVGAAQAHSAFTSAYRSVRRLMRRRLRCMCVRRRRFIAHRTGVTRNRAGWNHGGHDGWNHRG